MKKLTAIILLLLLILSGCASPDRQKVSMFENNGLKVILREMPESDIFSVGFYLNGGVAYTDETNTGIEELILNVAPKGTDHYNKEKLQELTEGMGTVITGNGGRDFSSLSMKCLEQNWKLSWDIFADIILNPLFDSTEIELARISQLTNIRTEKDNPDSYLGQISREFFYKGHPYSNSPDGTEENVSAFKREDLVAYHKNHFTKSRALLVVVGPIDKRNLAAFVRKLAKGLPQGPPFTSGMETNWEKSEPGLVAVKSEMPLPTNYVIGQANAPDRHSEDYFAFHLAARKLHTMVWEAVRTKRNLSYAPAAGFSVGNSSSTYLYVTTTQPDSAIKVMYGEINKLKETLLTEEEVNELRMMFYTRFYMGQETAASLNGSLAAYELSGVGYDRLDQFMDRVNGVTAEDIRRVARQYMKNYQFSFLGDPSQINEDVYLTYRWPEGSAEN